MHPNIQIISYALQQLKIPYSPLTIQQELLSHPNYPTLNSFQDTLALWKIPGMAVNLPPEQLTEIPYPAIAHLNKPKDSFVVLEGYKAGKVTFFEPGKGNISETVEDFVQKWSGVTLLLQKTEASGEPNYLQNLQKTRLQKSRKIALIGLSVLLSMGCRRFPLIFL